MQLKHRPNSGLILCLVLEFAFKFLDALWLNAQVTARLTHILIHLLNLYQFDLTRAQDRQLLHLLIHLLQGCVAHFSLAPYHFEKQLFGIADSALYLFQLLPEAGLHLALFKTESTNCLV